VPEHRVWPDSPSLPKLRQGILDGEKSRLRNDSVGNAALVSGSRVIGGIKKRPKVNAEMGAQYVRAAVDRIAEDRLGPIDFPPHVDVLRSLAREKKTDWASLRL
jgi:hypothetical protein